MKYHQYCAFFFLYVCLGVSCGRNTGKSFDPAIPGYKNKIEEMVVLKRPLREISGIDYVDDQHLAAINDEAGKLFTVDTRDGKFEVIEFGKKDDYEDLVRAGDAYFIMNSKGHLFEVDVKTGKLRAEYKTDFGRFVEFESICYDRELNQLILICKQCGEVQKTINAYRFDLASRQYLDGTYFSIDWKDVRRMAGDNAIDCKPSAASFNPIDNKLYIISSVGGVLLRCNRQGKPEAVFGFNPDHFPQPEGITFAPNGDMYISNEGVQGKGTLLKFVYQPQ